MIPRPSLWKRVLGLIGRALNSKLFFPEELMDKPPPDTYKIRQRLTGYILLEVNRPNLEGANLEGVKLICADMRESILTGANLSGGDLRGADLGWADLRGCDLRGCDLRRAKLDGANLSGAIRD